VQFKGIVPFGGPERRYNRGKFGYLKSIPLAYQCTNALIFGMKRYLGTRRFKFVQIKFLGS